MNILPIKQQKREIDRAIKDLDRSDYQDICTVIKSNLTSYPMVSETPKGTFIDLDMLDDVIITQLYNMVITKMKRIAER